MIHNNFLVVWKIILSLYTFDFRLQTRLRVTQVLPVEVMQDVVQFCAEEELLLLADEVYVVESFAAVPSSWFSTRDGLLACASPDLCPPFSLHVRWWVTGVQCEMACS